MQVFKFGGASVKDASSIKNVVNVLKTVGYKNTFIVLSAMGKTTNALESIIETYFNQSDYESEIENLKQKHQTIVNQLFIERYDSIKEEVDLIFDDLTAFFRRNKSPNYNFVYDQVVGYGEFVSTKIVSAYLNEVGIENEWLDARDYIKTDNTYREAKVNWEVTESNINQLKKDKLYLSQGFIGSDSNYFMTTLGREGSDFSAAIFAYCLNAENVTIWKDVPGVLNADPRHFDETVLLEKISYEEAIELAYYGASVIHPKTLKPLRGKEIPLNVKSFVSPKEKGTVIKNGQRLQPLLPCFIVKKKQHLVRFTSNDFSFISEEMLAQIFSSLKNFKLKVNLMQTLAVSLAFCLDDKYNQIQDFLDEIKTDFHIEHLEPTSLYTIRHYNQDADDSVSKNKTVLLRQTIGNTLQIVTKS